LGLLVLFLKLDVLVLLVARSRSSAVVHILPGLTVPVMDCVLAELADRVGPSLVAARGRMAAVHGHAHQHLLVGLARLTRHHPVLLLNLLLVVLVFLGSLLLFENGVLLLLAVAASVA